MQLPHARAALVTLCLLCLVPFLLADEPKAVEAKKEPEDKQVVSTKATKRTPASSVNFRKELALPFDSLATLGPRIDEARRKHDPVSLAHAASELDVAEKISGKKASLTSKQVIKESSELAKLRSQERELQAVLRVSDQVANEQDVILSLKQSIALAQERAKLDKETIDKNLEPTWKPRKVIVNNYTTQYLTIYVNGRYHAEISPGMTQICTIQHRWNPTLLSAHGNEDIDHWDRTIWGRFTEYTWNIN